jgi:flagellar basal body-associated protein FliL
MNEQKENKKGNGKKTIILVVFTVVFIISCCICSILGGLSVLGIIRAQLLNRDTNRMSLVQDVELSINTNYSENYSYPDENQVREYIINSVLNTEKFLTLSKETSSTGTAYCYKQIGDTYTLGAQLENGGKWYSVGNNPIIDCDEINI